MQHGGLPDIANSQDISLIIPAYNAEAFLGEAIRSALGQTVPPREIIVIDDGSTDGTAQAARSFGASVQLLRQANLGVAAARNRGIRAARSPWLALLDADDVMAPDRLEIQSRMLAENPKLDAVLGQQVFFSTSQGKEDPFAKGPQSARPALIPSALLCRASVFRRFGLFDAQSSGPEFIAWFAEAMHQGIAYAVAQQVVVYRRIHDNNVSRNLTKTDEYPRIVKLLLDKRRRAA